MPMKTLNNSFFLKKLFLGDCSTNWTANVMHNGLEGSQMIALEWLLVDKDVRWSYGIFTFCYVFPFFSISWANVRNRVQTPHFEWRTRTHLPFGVLKTKFGICHRCFSCAVAHKKMAVFSCACEANTNYTKKYHRKPYIFVGPNRTSHRPSKFPICSGLEQIRQIW